MDDPDLMREIMAALIEDTSRQLALLAQAILDRDATRCASLAHYSKGACANVGANRMADLLKQIEHKAAAGAFEECGEALRSLSRDVELLRTEEV